MSATFFGGEIKYTKRYRLGQLLSGLTRHFLLMTATPHNGKEEDFQLFMALIDGDRFEGRFRDGVHVAEVSDLMRRMVKENLLKFDSTPLFPESIAYTVPYRLSEAEACLYKAVTDYVREEINRAEVLDQATAARSIAELKAEIETLRKLEALALEVRRSGTNTEWRELASLLGEIFTAGGLTSRIAEPDVPYGAGEIPQPTPSPRQKLIVFTEHRDTLSYLHGRITTLLGREGSVVLIHGGVGREDRIKAQEAFRHDPQVQVLLATHAAGEGINLQRAHLMVNYTTCPGTRTAWSSASGGFTASVRPTCATSGTWSRTKRARATSTASSSKNGAGAASPRRAGVRRARQAPLRGVTSVNYDFAELLARAEPPS